MVIISFISYYSKTRFENSANQVYSSLIDKANNSSQEALENNTSKFLQSISKDRAAMYEDYFEMINIAMIKHKDYIEYVYQHPDLFVGHDVPHATEAKTDVYMEKYVLAPGVSMNEKISRELSFLSNLEYVFRPETENNNMMLMSYAGTESGVLYLYSDSDVVTEDFDPRERDWYKSAMERPDEIVWTSPYEGAMLAEPTTMVTCATTFRDGDGNIAGVLGIDVTISDLSDKILETQLGERGYAFLLDENGVIIAHKNESNPDFVMEPLLEEDISDSYRAVLEKMRNGKSGFEEVEIDNEQKYISYSSLSSLGWSLGIVIDVNEVMQPAAVMHEELSAISIDAQDNFNQESWHIVYRFIIIFVVLVVVVIVASLFLSNKLTTPIKQLAEGAKIIGQGNLDYVISVDTEDEIKDFADEFNGMTRDLKEYIQKIAVETKEREQIASELRIATDIQTDILPKVFPDFSERDDLELASFMKPAKEVGGDLYDFFFLDDTQRKIALVIADVSGKGVPAALFMVIAKVLIKNNKNLPVEEILGIVNNLLAEDNKATMFVTTYFSVLDLDTGEYTYASAGHNPPLLYRKESGEVSYLPLLKAPPLAVFPGKRFHSQKITLGQGDTLLLYTDGVTEAFNSQSEMYGTERLLENLELSIDRPVDVIIDEVYHTVMDFEGEEPQSDDITMLCFRYFGRGG